MTDKQLGAVEAEKPSFTSGDSASYRKGEPAYIRDV